VRGARESYLARFLAMGFGLYVLFLRAGFSGGCRLGWRWGWLPLRFLDFLDDPLE